MSPLDAITLDRIQQIQDSAAEEAYLDGCTDAAFGYEPERPADAIYMAGYTSSLLRWADYDAQSEYTADTEF